VCIVFDKVSHDLGGKETVIHSVYWNLKSAEKCVQEDPNNRWVHIRYVHIF
jgi:hypothetical protein